MVMEQAYRALAVLFLLLASVQVTFTAHSTKTKPPKIIEHQLDPKDINFHALPLGSHPEIFIIGAPKSGTTSLYRLFEKFHEQMCRPKHKELNYFATDDIYAKGSQFYQSQFSDGKCISDRYFEGTPSYLRNPEAPKRIFSDFDPLDLPDKKFIAILREPSYRRFSWYNHLLRECSENIIKRLESTKEPWDLTRSQLCGAGTDYGWACMPLLCESKIEGVNKSTVLNHLATFREYYINNANFGGNVDPSRLTQSGPLFYVDQIRNWLQYFDRKQIFIINFSTIIDNASDTIQRISRFLRLKPGFPANATFPRVNEARVSSVFDCHSAHELYLFYEQSNKELYDLLRTTKAHPEEPPFPRFERPVCEHHTSNRTAFFRSAE